MGGRSTLYCHEYKVNTVNCVLVLLEETVSTASIKGKLILLALSLKLRVSFRIMLHGGYFAYWKAGLVVVGDDYISTSGEALAL
ncbi:hypothetical protein Tco_0827659 [Tanacetum coccineum]